MYLCWFTKCIPRWEIVLFYQWYGFPQSYPPCSTGFPNWSWPHLTMPHKSPLSHPRLWPEHWLAHTPMAQGIRAPSEVTWPSHDNWCNHATTQATSSADLGPEGSNPLSLQSVTSRNTPVTLLTNFRILLGPHCHFHLHFRDSQNLGFALKLGFTPSDAIPPTCHTASGSSGSQKISSPDPIFLL